MQATMEPQLAVDEEHEFANIRQTREQGQALSGSFVAALEGTNRPIGPWKSIPLRKGDKIQVKAHARYEDKHKKDKDSQLGIFLQVTPGIRTQTDEFGQQSQSQETPNQVQAGISLNPNRSKPKENIPNAYLKLQIYDKDDNFIGSEIRYISSLAAEGWEKLQLEYEAPQDGRIELFVANQSNQEVYFDDVIATSTEAMIVQENHYYPFGMNIVSLEKNGEPDNKFQFNGVEKEEEFGLMWNETEFRSYDLQLGRWHQIDPKTSERESPYVGMGNNPIIYNDVKGDTIDLAKILIYDRQFNTNYANQIVNDLSEITGLSLSLNQESGLLTYDKDTDGNAIVAKTEVEELCDCVTQGSSTVIEQGSATARQDLIDAIDGDKIDFSIKNNGSATNSATNEIGLDPTQINNFINGTVNVGLNEKTFGFGMVALHEIRHTNAAGGFTDPQNRNDTQSTGDVVDRINIYRQELDNNPFTSGNKYGQRLHYMAKPSGNKHYVNFGIEKYNLMKGKFVSTTKRVIF